MPDLLHQLAENLSPDDGYSTMRFRRRSGAPSVAYEDVLAFKFRINGEDADDTRILHCSQVEISEVGSVSEAMKLADMDRKEALANAFCEHYNSGGSVRSMAELLTQFQEQAVGPFDFEGCFLVSTWMSPDGAAQNIFQQVDDRRFSLVWVQGVSVDIYETEAVAEEIENHHQGDRTYARHSERPPAPLPGPENFGH